MENAAKVKEVDGTETGGDILPLYLIKASHSSTAAYLLFVSKALTNTHLEEYISKVRQFSLLI
jgi:hypothetical protein